MADFTNIGLTNINWDLTSTLDITEPYIDSVTITATVYQEAILT